jgi:hypothetical protein
MGLERPDSYSEAHEIATRKETWETKIHKEVIIGDMKHWNK